MAGAIADEKERRTLEFLLATDLRDREILFGKLASRVGSLLLFLLAGLPILGLMQFFGGIDPDLVLAGFAATFATVLSLAAVGIAASVLSRKVRDAIALTYLVAIAYVLVSFIVFAPRVDPGVALDGRGVRVHDHVGGRGLPGRGRQPVLHGPVRDGPAGVHERGPVRGPGPLPALPRRRDRRCSSPGPGSTCGRSPCGRRSAAAAGRCSPGCCPAASRGGEGGRPGRGGSSRQRRAGRPSATGRSCGRKCSWTPGCKLGGFGKVVVLGLVGAVVRPGRVHLLVLDHRAELVAELRDVAGGPRRGGRSSAGG